MVVFALPFSHDRIMKTDTTSTEPVNAGESGLFVTGGKNLVVTFCLVSSLFLLWGICNSMIDVMDKHFQEELKLSLSQSAWVQFAHYLGYFLMSLLAGWLTMKLGYKVGIIAGLLLVAAGGFWFVPATNITAFWAYLLGVCAIASGLTFLETVANPYTTVLGPRRYAATRINMAQSCNGMGWLLGPIIGAQFFYSKDAAGRSTGSQTLWIPYAVIAAVVLILAVAFYFAYVPDIQTKDVYKKEEEEVARTGPSPVAGKPRFQIGYILILANAAVLTGILGMFIWLLFHYVFDAGSHFHGIASALNVTGMAITDESALALTIAAAAIPTFAFVAFLLGRYHRKMSEESIWSHSHFSGATVAQFLYVAAQAGIFSFFINYMTTEPPSLSASWLKEDSTWIEVRTAFGKTDYKDLPSFAERLSRKADPLSTYLESKLSDPTRKTLALYREGLPLDIALRVELSQDLSSLIAKESLYTPERFAGVTLGPEAQKLIKVDFSKRSPARLNRLLLADAYPRELTFADSMVVISNKFASILQSVGFGFFLLGRIVGSALLAKFSAHKIVGLYGVLNVFACLMVVFHLSWLSVACVFLSFFFMSIMFPTIFALGIFGLGVRAKKASAYIVMAIMGGAILPKIMGAVADHHDMSRGFLVPMVCFVLIALYGFSWPKLSGAESLHGVATTGRH